jgi:uncharacterized LabA/DUF88 family protein
LRRALEEAISTLHVMTGASNSDYIGIFLASIPDLRYEKGLDVLLTVDTIAMAMKDEYHDAYLMSTDADYVPLVAYLLFILKKKVFVCPQRVLDTLNSRKPAPLQLQ